MSDQILARTEFAAALNQIASERGIDPNSILESLKQALVAAYRKDFQDEFQQYEDDGAVPEAVVDNETGEFRIVVKFDDGTSKDVTPPGFGRIAAQTAKQVVLQQVREAEKNSIIDEYTKRMGELITAQVLRFEGKNVILDIGRGYATMPVEEQIPGEFYRLNSRIAVIIADIRETFKGQAVIVSRADVRLVKELFAREVPEVGTDVVVIERIARQPGVRTKVAVKSTQEGVDPVGSCVGQKGVRVQAVINELNGERIDIIQYSDDPKKLLEESLSPAENLEIELGPDNKTAIVTVPEDQLSLAIGKGGQNVKLAARICNMMVSIKSGKILTSQVSGEEEYEIDLLGLDEETRQILIDNGIMLLDQILGHNFKRLSEIKDLTDNQREMIAEKLAAYQEKTPVVESQEESTVETAPADSASETKEETTEESAE